MEHVEETFIQRTESLPIPYSNPPELPEIALSALTETGKAEATILVLKQRSFTGSRVITSSLANTPCAALGVDGVLEKLNTTLGTSHTSGSVVSILEPYVAQNYDFGTVYAYLRRSWDDYDLATIEHELRTLEEEDRERRRKVLVHDRITARWVDPRHVWDLYANRVVPYWVADERPWGISHAWVDEKDRVDVMTPINGYEWPVPMPKDANLDLIRIEMLNLMRDDEADFRAGYAWLDILCLRQEGGKNERLRVEEWKLDVPTIGWVYTWPAHVVCYFNGLGRPLHLTPDYFKSDRCWFRRAWTLQEVTEDAIIGGETGDDIMEKEVWKTFDEQLMHLREIRNRDLVIELVLEMQDRVSTKSLDKVAGLAYLLRLQSIPIYDAKKSDVDAWEVLMDAMLPLRRAELFFYFPEPGKGRKCWRPSWQQIMMLEHFVPYSFPRSGKVYQTEDTDEAWCEGYCINSADVWGLAEGLMEEKPRQGELAFKDATGSPHTLKIVAHHEYPIPDGSYTLIGCDDVGHLPSDIWVVGRLRDDGKFQKLSVFRSVDDEPVRLGTLGLGIVKTFLC
ncbi:hypothetical protein ARMSODRAFT_964212 [Armillaria solidipes]|uniref:Heterokaryon incompatibility domain-containing protein n=1 Tax=Armillaria solidipes TaxID=1076256 RepID=A0A2H3B0B8_9AGAR|nr:hypothetical protein ARMSODRAFT_964212 [Armillaria solidipes]